MKKLMVLTVALLVSISSLLAHQPDEVKGIWLNEERDVKIEIYKSGERYAGKITWMKVCYEPDGKTPKKDSKNLNEKLRDRAMLNLVILSGFVYDNKEWTGGQIYDPKTGKTYNGKVKVKGSTLEIRGWVGSPMFGKTKVWTRVS